MDMAVLTAPCLNRIHLTRPMRTFRPFTFRQLNKPFLQLHNSIKQTLLPASVFARTRMEQALKESFTKSMFLLG
jgi:hypothetical protein